MADRLAVPPPNRKNRKQAPQQNIDEFWTAFKTNYPGKVHTILPQNQHAIQKARLKPQGPIQSQSVFESYEHARKECQAVVDKISKECRRVNQRYRDIHFDMEFDLKLRTRYCLEKLVPDGPSPPGPRSVKRVAQIFDNAKFYIDGASPNDIRQGRDGDCWFLAGLSACIQRPGWIDRICVARDESVGVYGFVFHRDGDWFHTVIDDRLYLGAADFDESYQEKAAMFQLNNPPNEEEAYKNFYQTGSKALWFAQCATDNETWLPLIEKAYAKAHGDYSAIDGGFTGEAIEDLTGGVTTEVWTSDILDEEKFWQELLLVNREFLFGCATGWSDDFLGAASWTNRKNIHAGHAYSIMEAREVKDQRLLKLRNPWGNSEWKGPWSDGSAEWTPEWMELLGHRFGDDGVFWISFKDLLKKFSHFDRTRLFSTGGWMSSQQWVSLEVPWTTDYHDTKFEFDLKKASKCIIALSQLDTRYFLGLEGQYYFDLQFRVEKEGEDGYIVRSSTSYFMSRSCSVELELEAGTYSVIMKINADRIPMAETPEQVVRRLYKTKREKLLQVGFSYDLAHAKALPYETEEDRVYAKAQRHKEKEAAKKKAKEEVRYRKWVQWDRLRREKERNKRYKARVEEHKRKKAAKKEEEEKEEEEEELSANEREKQEEAVVVTAKQSGVASQSDSESSQDELGRKLRERDERRRRSTGETTDEIKVLSASSERPEVKVTPSVESEDQKYEVVSTPDAPVVVSSVSSDGKEEGSEEGNAAKVSEQLSKETEEGVVVAAPETTAGEEGEASEQKLMPPPEAPIAPPSAPVPPEVDNRNTRSAAPLPPAPAAPAAPAAPRPSRRRRERSNGSDAGSGYVNNSVQEAVDDDNDSILSWATSIDTRLDLSPFCSDYSDDSDSYSYSRGGRRDRDRRSMSRSSVSSTCSTCSRATSTRRRQKAMYPENRRVADDAWNAVCVVGLRVFSKTDTSVRVVRPRSEDPSLDVDDVSKAISGDKPVVDHPEVHKPSIDGQRPPLQQRRSFGVTPKGAPRTID